MLVENDRILSHEILGKSHPIVGRKGKSRDLKLWRFADKHIIYNGDISLDIIDISSLFKLSIGSDCIICDPNNFFTEILSGCDTTSLWKNGKITIDDMVVSVASKDRSFFNIRCGNLWSSIWVWSDDLTVSELKSKISGILEGFEEYGWKTDRVLPPPKMFERLLIEKTSFNDFPSISEGDIDEIVLFRSWNCFRGGRMESAKLGLCKNVFDYDYNSAYFSILRDLPPLRLIKWIDTKEYIKDAYFGFCKCYVDIDDNAPIGLVAIRVDTKNRPSRLFYTVGENVSWRTKDDIDLIRKSGFGKVKILEGSWGILSHEYSKLFYSVSNVLEKAIFDPRTRNLAKAMASVCWGKFASADSSWFNPIYAAYITSRIRNRVTEMALLMERDLVAVTVDGLALEREIPNKDIVSGEIGAFKKREVEQMISLSDIYRYEKNKPPSTWVPNDDGIFINELNLTVPYGSSKRKSPTNLSFKILENEQFVLSPPTTEEAVEIYIMSKSTSPWDVW